MLAVFISTAASGAPVDPDTPIEERYEPAKRVMDLMKKKGRSAKQEVLEITEQAVKDDPDKADAYLLRGFAKLKLVGTKAAMPDFEKAYELAPTDPMVVAQLAGLYLGNQALDAAEKVIAPALEAHPKSLTVGLMQASLLNKRGELDEAVNLLQPIAEQDKLAELKAAAQMVLADIYIKQEKYDLAIEAVKGVLRTNPSEQLRVELGDLYEKNNQHKEALAEYKRALNGVFAQFRIDVQSVEKKVAALEAKIAALEYVDKPKQPDKPEAPQQQEPGNQPGDAEILQLLTKIDAYRTNPTNAKARIQALRAAEPYAIKHEADDSRMLWLGVNPDRLKETKPNPKRADLLIAKLDAEWMSLDRRMLNLWWGDDRKEYERQLKQVYAVYPLQELLYRRAVDAFQRGAYPDAYDDAVLAQAVYWAEYAHNPQPLRETPVATWFQARDLSAMARRFVNREYTPTDRQLLKIIQLQHNVKLYEADQERIKLLEQGSLAAFDASAATRGVALRGWDTHRKQLEDIYSRKFTELAVANDRAGQEKIAQYMFERSIGDKHFISKILSFYMRYGEREKFDRFATYAQKIHPNNPIILGYIAMNARAQDQSEKALLYYNAAAQYTDRTDMTGAAKRVLQGHTKDRAKEEAKLKPNVAQGIWNAALAYEKNAANAPYETWKPAVAAAAMRVVELAPDNPDIAAKAVDYRYQSGDHAGAIAYGEMCLNKYPEHKAKFFGLLGNAYRYSLPSHTADQDALKANYIKAIAYYNMALEAGAANEALVRFLNAQMYEALGMMDEALAGYQYAAEHHPQPHSQAVAYYKLARIGEDKGTLDNQQALELYRKASNAFARAERGFTLKQQNYQKITMLKRAYLESEKAQQDLQQLLDG